MKNITLLLLIILFSFNLSCSAQSANTENKNSKPQETKTEAKPTKINMENLSAILVSLEIENKNSLFVLLAKDGTINRLGTGTEDNTENSMYIGITKKEVFENYLKQIDQKVFDWQGEYNSPEIKGKTCKLTILFKLNDGTEAGSIWTYGTQSLGPPPEIRKFVVSAVEASEPWYEEQKRIKKP